MPIRVQCACGKALAAPDTAAGKAVKCPACGQVVKVPSAAAQPTATGSPSAQPAGRTPQPAGRKPQPAGRKPQAGGGNGLDSMFDEEGFSDSVSAVCPACRKSIKAGSVLCTQCGYHLTEGVRLGAHKTPGVDISHGELALEKASEDMAKEKRLQKDLEEGGSMPTWMLGLILTILTGLILIGVLAINFSRAAEQSGESNTFNAAEIFCLFGGICCVVVGLGLYLQVLYQAYTKDRNTALLTAFVPGYILYFAWVYRGENKNLKNILMALVITGLGAAFFYGASVA